MWRKSYHVAVLIFTVLLFGCEKSDEFKADVDTYIQQLLKGKYEQMELPEFSPAHIPALLEFRNDSSIIIDFPHNPISSLWMEECRLGVYVLWTIESIRACEIQSETLIGRFPSQNPFINFRQPDLMMPYDPARAHDIAAQAYRAWWYSNTSLSIKLDQDPLENTAYSWH